MPIGKIVLFLAVIIGGVVLQKHYSKTSDVPPAKPTQTLAAKPVVESVPVGPVIKKKAYRTNISEAQQRLSIGENLRVILRLANQYRYDHPGALATLSAIVGPGKEFQIESQVGEDYPEQLPPGPISATRPDGKIFICDDLGNITRSDDPPEPALPLVPEDEIYSHHSLSRFSLDVQERFVARFDKVDAAIVFQAMLAEHDTERHEAIKYALSKKLRKPISADFRALMTTFLGKKETSQSDRTLLLGAIIASGNPAMVRYICELADNDKSPWASGAARDALEKLNETELQQVWCEYNNEMLLKRVGIPLARIGTPKSADLIIRGVLYGGTWLSGRETAARQAMGFIPKGKVQEAFLAHLKDQPLDGKWGTWLASEVLEGGTEEGGRAVLERIMSCKTDIGDLLKFVGPTARSKPQLSGVWDAALEKTVIFNNEKNREAIRDYLASPTMLYPLKNGSFESGQFDGFALEGSGRVEKGWIGVNPTERQYLAMLDTMENPIDGITTLTTEAFEVPGNIQTLLFDYHFAATALFKKPSDVLEVQISSGGAPTIDSEVFADIEPEDMEIDAPRSRYDRGTGFRTTGISLKNWAGTGKKIRVKFILRGRGKLPDHIPGTNLYDQNPMGGGESSTALFLDNLRLSESAETRLARVDPKAVTLSYDGKTTATITTAPGAFPAGTVFQIWDLGNEPRTIELGDKTQITTDFNVGENSIYFLFSYTTPGAGGRGKLFSPQLKLYIDRHP